MELSPIRSLFPVEAYTASWIEIKVVGSKRAIPIQSKPIRLRGLKFRSRPGYFRGVVVEAYTASWIEMVLPATAPLLESTSKPIRFRGYFTMIVIQYP